MLLGDSTWKGLISCSQGTAVRLAAESSVQEDASAEKSSEASRAGKSPHSSESYRDFSSLWFPLLAIQQKAAREMQAEPGNQRLYVYDNSSIANIDTRIFLFVTSLLSRMVSDSSLRFSAYNHLEWASLYAVNSLYTISCLYWTSLPWSFRR